MEVQLSREQKFLMLIQTAAIVKQLSGEVEDVKIIRVANLQAHHVLHAAMTVIDSIPRDMNIVEAADDFIEYFYSKEGLPRKPDWMLDSGL